MIETPTLQQIREAREKAGLSQAEAAAMVYLGSRVRWSEYETGRSPIDLARWELFLFKTGQHPALNPARK